MDSLDNADRVGIFFGIIGFMLVPVTFEPVLYRRKAERLRHQTKNWALYIKMDEDPVHVRALFERYFSKPLLMLFQEPTLTFPTKELKDYSGSWLKCHILLYTNKVDFSI
jgi:hypothetical protein